MDDLPDCLIDEVASGNGSAVPVEHTIFLDPVHHEEPKESSNDANGLQRHEEAVEHEQVTNVDILIANFELNAFMDTVKLFLVDSQFFGCITSMLPTLEFQHFLNFCRKLTGSKSTTKGATKAVEKDIMKMLSTKPLAP